MSHSGGIGTSELIDLLASFVVLTIAFSMIGEWMRAPDANSLLVSALAVGSGFLLHELAHKFVAQRYGYWAEYKAWYPGLILTLVMSFMGFIIAMPGAVQIHKVSDTSFTSTYSYSDTDDAYWDRLEKRVGGEELWISLAGPITNIILAAIFFSMFMYFRGTIPSSSLLMVALSYALFLNLVLAAFNLLPIGPMDGAKIFRGNAIVWVVVAVPIILITLYVMFGGGKYFLLG